MMHAVPEILRSAAAFVVVIGILVFIHEFGHYAAARLCGVHVEAFSIGFGRSIASWTDSHGTVWKVSWIPLGGYVKLHGQEQPQDASEDVRALWLPGRTFHDKEVGKRAIVVAAGPIFNFLLAALLFGAIFAVGGRPTTAPIVGEVSADSPASRAGLQTNDRIERIDGNPVAQFTDLQAIVSSHPGVALTMLVRRGDGEQTIVATPEAREEGGHVSGLLGIRSQNEQLSIPAALFYGFEQTGIVTEQTLVGIWEMITGHRGTEQLGGPLRIAQLSGQVAQLGIANLITFIAMLSVNLGLINLFPIPILDGGHLLFYFFEAIRGRPLPRAALNYGFRAGLAVLLCLFVFATWNDLSHLGVVRWVAGLIG